MIISDWQTFRRSFGYFATIAGGVGTNDVTYTNGGAGNDTIVRASNKWGDDGFLEPSGFVTGWVTASGTVPPIEAALLFDGFGFTDFTAQARSAGPAFSLLTPAAADDAFYFGSSRVFDAIRIDVTAGAGTWTIAWEYWDGTNWSTLDFVFAPSKAVLDDGGVFNDETERAASADSGDARLLPPTGNIVINDAFYVGSTSVFGAVQFVITTNAVAETWVITWEYWDGSAWSALGGVVDGTAGLKTLGTNRLSFTVPGDWTPVEADGSVPGQFYHVRGRVSVGAVPAVRPLASTVSPIILVTDGTGGFIVVGTNDVTFSLPDNWVQSAAGGVGPFFYARARVSSFTSQTTQPMGDTVFMPGANDGDYPLASIVTDTLTVNNENYPSIARLIDETSSPGTFGFELRHLDDGDGVVHWPLELVRAAGSGFGDAGSTMSGITIPVPLTGSVLTSNGGASDAVAYTDEYNWFVSQQTPVPSLRYLDVSEVLEPDEVTPRSGSVLIALSQTGADEFSVTAPGFTAVQLANVYRDCYAYVQRISDDAIQLVDLAKAATTGVQ